jgi:hypothetical protein
MEGKGSILTHGQNGSVFYVLSRKIAQLLPIWLALGLALLDLDPLMLLSCVVAPELERTRTPAWGLTSDR